MKLVVTIPACNEEKLIPSVITEILRSIKGIDSVEILVVDDGSKDNTISAVLSADTNVVVRHRRNKGLGTTFKDGLEALSERPWPTLVTEPALSGHGLSISDISVKIDL